MENAAASRWLRRLRQSTDISDTDIGTVRESSKATIGGTGPVYSEPRTSFPDERALYRAIQRRKVLEELIATEEAYVADLRFFAGIYGTFLTADRRLPHHIKTSVQQNIHQILHLHDDLLGGLYATIPDHEYYSKEAKEPPMVLTRGHVRWNSTESTGTTHREANRIARRLRHSFDFLMPSKHECPPGFVVDPDTVGAAVRAFEKLLKNISIYEEYAARYELMLHYTSPVHRELERERTMDKGVELLGRTLASLDSRKATSDKSLTLHDLKIKPIQRLMRYPLLLEQLCRYTPVSDAPKVHTELESTIDSLRNAVHGVNAAITDPDKREVIRKTSMLLERLEFEQEISRHGIRMAGILRLCGVLFVTYQTKTSGVKGDYMLSALFDSCLLLALAVKNYTCFVVSAMAPMRDLRLEEHSSRRGLRCVTAPYTWKIVFELETRQYELMLTACSSREEQEWTSQLASRAETETAACQRRASNFDTEASCRLSLDLKERTSTTDEASAQARFITLKRSQTLKTIDPPSQEVIISNTYGKESENARKAIPARSQSVKDNPLPSFAPKRSQRVRMEMALEDVWTKSVLPYPGIATDGVFSLRKLSLRNLGFRERSQSVLGSVVDRAPAAREIVNFHATPEMFLPEDFALKGLRKKATGRFFKF